MIIRPRILWFAGLAVATHVVTLFVLEHFWLRAANARPKVVCECPVELVAALPDPPAPTPAPPAITLPEPLPVAPAPPPVPQPKIEPPPQPEKNLRLVDVPETLSVMTKR